ncbi:MAG: bifunctional folylpolyglutamate synthase/dihydrofolate synthase [Clostridiales bacterium]|nr:MAG: bifunctional folylpolyglutamate synthase/dihydrofolate synthase [Clostridiales bacterium]
MNYRQALEYIHSQKRFGPKPGLERIQKLLSLLGNPQDRLRFVHVAGTNGKGSTTVMTASVLQEAGYKTGVFISPYVLDFRERMQVDREMISEADLTQLVERVRPLVEQMRAGGEIVAEFELVTALAMCYFEQQRCDIVCLEVGIGGRFDSTNVIAPPLAAVITAISLDHTQMLGDTVEQIAVEKAGIIKRNTDVVCYAKQDPGALAVLMQHCAETGSRLILPSAGSVEIKSLTAFGSDFAYGGEEYHIRLAGEHQVYNALSAIETIRVLQNKGFAVREEQLKNGLANAKFPARFEVLHERPMIILDGAHNPDGAKALAAALHSLGKVRIAAVVGMLAEKAVDTLLSEIGPLCTRMIAVDIDNPRALGRDALCTEASAYCADCRSASDYIEAIRLAAEAVGEDGIVIICGSLYLAADIREIALAYKN